MDPAFAQREGAGRQNGGRDDPQILQGRPGRACNPGCVDEWPQGEDERVH